MNPEYSIETKAQTFSDWIKEGCINGDSLMVIKLSIGNRATFLHNKRTNQVFLLEVEQPNIIEKTRNGVEL